MTANTITFPHDPLTKCNGQPTATYLFTLRQEIYANLAVCDSSAGGDNGLIYLATTAAEYHEYTGGDALPVAPANPGDQPAHVTGATQAQITQANREYDSREKKYDYVKQVSISIKGLLHSAVDDAYTAAVRHPKSGYARCSIADLLGTLQTLYGTLLPRQIDELRDTMAMPHNPDETLANFWRRISDIRCVAADAGAPISDDTTITHTFRAFSKAGVYDVALSKWNDKSQVDKTLPNFQEFMRHQDFLRLEKITAQAAGFHGANHVTPEPTYVPVPAAYVPAPIAHNQPPPDAHLAAALQRTTLHTEPHSGFGYCWTHGLTTSMAHTSATCERRRDGHQAAATLFHRMNGSDMIGFGQSRATSRGNSGTANRRTPYSRNRDT